MTTYEEVVEGLQQRRAHANDLSTHATELGAGIDGYSKDVRYAVGEVVRQGGEVFGAAAEYLDPHIWEKVRAATAQGFDADSYTMQKILWSASSEDAEIIMKWSMGRPHGAVTLTLGQIGLQIGQSARPAPVSGQLNDQIVSADSQPQPYSLGQLVETGIGNRSNEDGAQDAIVPEGWNFSPPDKQPLKVRKSWQEVFKAGGRVVLRQPNDDNNPK